MPVVRRWRELADLYRSIILCCNDAVKTVSLGELHWKSDSGNGKKRVYNFIGGVIFHRNKKIGFNFA